MVFPHSSSYAKLTDEQHQLIGMFVTEWANAEHLLGQTLSRLLLCPVGLASTMIDSLSAAQIESALNNAIEIHKNRYHNKIVSEEVLSEIYSINKNLSKLRAIRNQYAHCCWMRVSDREIFGTSFSAAFPTDKRIKKSQASQTVEEIKRQYEILYSNTHMLYQIYQNLPELTEEQAISSALRRFLAPLNP